MKNLLPILLLVISSNIYAQKIDGFYTGVLHNDSAKMIQKYELAIAMYKGKISGYSYVTFIANDTFYYGIRKVKGEIVGDSMIIVDDKHVSNNFPEPPAKGVRRTIVIPLNGQDSLTSIQGSWKTNRNKRYYSVPGSIEMTKSSDSSSSPLISHLKELQIIPDYNNYVAVAEPQPKPEKQKPVKTDNKETVLKNNPVRPEKQEKTVTVMAPPTKLSFDQRKTKTIQTVEISSDSLVLAFYDNGVVDGDSISVYMNGEKIVSAIKLTTAATKKTISVKDLKEIQLLLVAENLGSIPPNTGLLSIRDGDKIYQVNFSADMQTNAGIVLKRE